MKIHLTILFFLFTPFLFAQTNLVPNPSFELFTACPSYQGQVNRLLNWYDPNQGSSDFIATCATNIMVAVPYNFVGTQNARTGNNYTGFGSFPWTESGQYPMLCEYLQVQLIQPLIANKTYYVSFYISLADSSEYYTQSVAASFGDTAIHINCPYQLHLPPHIIANNPLNDTMNWQKIDGYYHAHGGEQYLTIGYFNNDTTSIDTIKFQDILPGGICDTGAYYYLDDVLVVDSSDVGINEQQENDYLNIYPNPATNELTLDFILSEKSDFELFDLIGAKKKEVTLNCGSQTERIDLTDIDSGLYFYSVVDRKGNRIKTGKLIVIK